MIETGTKQYYEDYWGRTLPHELNDRHAELRLRLLLRHTRHENGTLHALDVGAGLGNVVAALRHEGVEAKGIDISTRAVTAAARRHRDCSFTEHDVEELPWPVEPSSLDVVVAFEVIEHLLRPRRLLEGAREALKPGGHLALTTPYHGVLKNAVIMLVNFDRHFAVEGDHVRFFSDRALKRLLHETGFELRRATHFGRMPGLSAGVFVWARRR